MLAFVLTYPTDRIVVDIVSGDTGRLMAIFQKLGLDSVLSDGGLAEASSFLSKHLDSLLRLFAENKTPMQEAADFLASHHVDVGGVAIDDLSKHLNRLLLDHPSATPPSVEA